MAEKTISAREVKVEKFTIALVTDEEELWGVEKVRLALSAAGYKIVATKNWQALEVVERIQPDLIIANLAGDHPEDLRLCKLLTRSVQAPLIVIGSAIQSSQILAMFEAGITDYLIRPINLRELIARVRNVLNRTKPPFQEDETAAFSVPKIENAQNTKIQASKALRGLAGWLARYMPQRIP
jgi:two-component system alkaline phosphatase synthesis response regulator PhoP